MRFLLLVAALWLVATSAFAFPGGVPIDVQQKSKKGWVTIGTTVTNPDGSWSFDVKPTYTTTYRAVSHRYGDYAPAVSAEYVITMKRKGAAIPRVVTGITVLAVTFLTALGIIAKTSITGSA